MKYCEYCGAELEDSMRFCGQCGKKVADMEAAPVRDFWAERLQQEKKPAFSGREEIRDPVPEPGEPETFLTDPISPALPEDYDEPVSTGPCRDLRKRWLLIGAAVLCGILILGLVIFLSLRKPAVQEVYLGRGCIADGKKYPGEGDRITLDSEGRARVCLLGSETAGTWKQSGSTVILNCGDTVYAGTLEAGILTLQQGNVQFILAQEGITEIPDLQVFEEEKPVEFTGWEGNYYGWWQISQAWGQWEAVSGQAFDVCGRIWLEQPGQGKLELWDTQCRLGELFCAADVEITGGLTEMGCLQSGMGRLLDFELRPGDWVVDPGREPWLSCPDLLCFSGSFREGDSGFAYEIYLRPWGMQWDDLKNLPAGVLPGDRRLPEHYRDWYLPLLKQKKEMPESFYDLRAEPENKKNSG